MKNFKSILFFLSMFFLLTVGFTNCNMQKSASKKAIKVYEIDSIWAGCSANYDMLTVPPFQFVAYYDSSRYMTIAQRRLSENTWIKTRLPSQVEWDSHNYITMAIDSKGCLHVSGNMHVVPLVYFQSEKPFDVTSFKQQISLVGNKEEKVTYPQFFKAPNDDLIFTYRTGSSGKGNQIYNRYNAKTHEWSRLLDTPLVDGEGKSNAYLHGPILGPDGYFHLIWVWRKNPDANANCNISYAKSKDLIFWEKSDGSAQPLPITMSNCEIIDPIPIGNGLLNGNTKIGFDTNDRVIVSYHKYDKKGNIQIYNARNENGKWFISQATNWDWRWEFGGWGSISARVGLSEVSIENKQLVQTFFVDTVGTQKFIINNKTLQATTSLKWNPVYPQIFLDISGELSPAQVNTVINTTASGSYVLRWETLKRNRDKAYDFIPDPQPLRLYYFPNK